MRLAMFLLIILGSIGRPYQTERYTGPAECHATKLPSRAESLASGNSKPRS
jgi:hypothetical protein